MGNFSETGSRFYVSTFVIKELRTLLQRCGDKSKAKQNDTHGYALKWEPLSIGKNIICYHYEGRIVVASDSVDHSLFISWDNEL